ncbi:hypothetical protein HYQ45_015441 [Verticillium longisporum]|uniref:Uncharacterized protein n=1 Tax=Verticillium longisporum TaxID=100787 RepID=A0A8I2ZA72_VERLO|nr:hypothetical protein HYQ44_005854 [Verticillium longisporum]KAG7118857.1 hypothetical protein HYQ45_015441 [Verticillium longisporum]KAG7137044.1 hypothetical protein HYQ46_008628 [Verticillium longisporum]
MLEGLPGKRELPEYSFYENRFVSLSGLIWAFDHNLDYISTATSRRDTEREDTLILYDIVEHWRNTRFTNKVFWEILDNLDRLT